MELCHEVSCHSRRPLDHYPSVVRQGKPHGTAAGGQHQDFAGRGRAGRHRRDRAAHRVGSGRERSGGSGRCRDVDQRKHRSGQRDGRGPGHGPEERIRGRHGRFRAIPCERRGHGIAGSRSHRGCAGQRVADEDGRIPAGGRRGERQERQPGGERAARLDKQRSLRRLSERPGRSRGAVERKRPDHRVFRERIDKRGSHGLGFRTGRAGPRRPGRAVQRDRRTGVDARHELVERRASDRVVRGWRPMPKEG